MKLLRLRLRDFRGVTNREVEFTAPGVTVLAGPNEIGKTSIAEALNLVLEELDSSKKKGIRAVQPVDRDVGPEVELEAQAGPYHFTIRKRFLRNEETILSVAQPRSETWTGREAHQRMRAILEESVDLDLWKALRIDQGGGTQQMKPGGERWLTAALDRAAGDVGTSALGDTLFDASGIEKDRFFTPKEGRETGDLGAAREAGDEAERRAREAQERLGRFEKHLEEAESFRTSISTLDDHLREAAETVRQRSTERREVERLERECERLRTQRAEAETALQAATREHEARLGAVEGVNAIDSQIADATERRTALATELAAAERRVQVASEEYAVIKKTAEEAESVDQLQAADFEYHRDKLDRDMLRERLERIATALTDLEAAEATLQGTRVNEAEMEVLKEAELAARIAEARHSTDAASIEFSATAATAVEIDGKSVSVPVGDPVRLPVLRPIRVDMSPTLDLTVRPGVEAGQLEAEAGRATNHLVDLLSDLGVSSVREAETAFAAQTEADVTAQRARAVIEENVRDLSGPDEVRRRLANLSRRVEAYESERGSDPPLPATFDEAQQMRDRAHVAVLQAERDRQDHQEAFETANEILRARRSDLPAVEEEIRLRQEERARRQDELEKRRAERSDNDVERGAQAAEERCAELQERLVEGEEMLDLLDPANVLLFAETAEQALAQSQEELEESKRRLASVDGILREQGGEGLAEQADNAAATAEWAARRLADTERRARAAKLLYETLAAERVRLRLAYLAPLARRINDFGQIVFGQTFEAVIDDDFRIVSRSLNGITIPFESLSHGAKEQLGVISRLAVGMLVSDEGGVPIIIDDALGYADPKRLEAMGAVLQVAGRVCQVIVLTCVPDRYHHIGELNLVSLD